MVKVSITLPNNAQITFESEEPEVIHEIVGMVLRDLPRELMQSTAHLNGNGTGDSDVTTVSAPAVPGFESTSNSSLPSASPKTPAKRSDGGSSQAPRKPARRENGASQAQALQQQLTGAQGDFVGFCQTANPLGDMRRVVVAAEGAHRYLGRDSVDSEELGRLFDLVGWQRPHSIMQTLRNSARSKFRWLERVPGRSGQYKVTAQGRSTALGG